MYLHDVSIKTCLFFLVFGGEILPQKSQKTGLGAGFLVASAMVEFWPQRNSRVKFQTPERDLFGFKR